MSARKLVTDHTVLRYLERVAGLDVEAIRTRILGDTSKALAAGATGITVNGISYRFEHGHVSTIWIAYHHARDLNWQDGDKK